MNIEEANRLSEALVRGQKAAEQLGAATDELTETLAQIERALAEQRLGVSASVFLSQESPEDGEHQVTGPGSPTELIGLRSQLTGLNLVAIPPGEVPPERLES